MSQQVKPSQPSIYAATGTVAHELIEEASNNDPVFTLSRSELVGTKREVDGVEVLIDEDMLDAVNILLVYARTGIKGRLFKAEMRVYPKLPIAPPIDVFGSLDLMIIDAKAREMEIIDYKHGAGVPVKVENNPQLLYYAAGALATLRPIAPLFDPKKIKLTIVQPRVPGGEPIKSWEINSLDLALWVEDVLVPGIEACLKPKAPYHSGDHCRFCPGTARCPELLQKAVNTAVQEFEDFVLPEKKMTLAEQLDLADMLETWIGCLREYAKTQISEGKTITGWRLVPTRPTRKWTNEKEVEETLVTWGVERKAFRTDQLLSPAQMEKVIKGRYGQVNWDALSKYVTAQSSGTKLSKTEQDNFDLLEALDG